MSTINYARPHRGHGPGGGRWRPFGASGITGEEPFIDKERKGEVHPQYLAKGEALGRRVAELARRLQRSERGNY